MSAIMYSRLIIEEYTGKRLALLFSYPISRSKIFAAKLVLIFTFTCIYAVLALGVIGIVSMRIGFIHKSVPTTLISTILLSAVYGNAVIYQCQWHSN